MLSLSLVISLVSFEPVSGQFFTKAQSKSIPRMGRRSEESTDQTQSVESSDQLISSLKVSHRAPESPLDETKQMIAFICSLLSSPSLPQQALDANNEINKSFVSSSSDHGSPSRWQLREKTAANYNMQSESENEPRQSDRPTFESPEFDLFYFINRRRR